MSISVFICFSHTSLIWGYENSRDLTETDVGNDNRSVEKLSVSFEKLRKIIHVILKSESYTSHENEYTKNLYAFVAELCSILASENRENFLEDSESIAEFMRENRDAVAEFLRKCREIKHLRFSEGKGNVDSIGELEEELIHFFDSRLGHD